MRLQFTGLIQAIEDTENVLPVGLVVGTATSGVLWAPPVSKRAGRSKISESSLAGGEGGISLTLGSRALSSKAQQVKGSLQLVEYGDEAVETGPPQDILAFRSLENFEMGDLTLDLISLQVELPRNAAALSSRAGSVFDRLDAGGWNSTYGLEIRGFLTAAPDKGQFLIRCQITSIGRPIK